MDKTASAPFKVETLKSGDNKNYPRKGARVQVHYIGFFPDGRKFDSSRDREEPFEFNLGKGEVIKGWDEGIAKMSIGEKARITCPHDYAYGTKGISGVIPPYSTLIFEVELLSYHQV